LALFCSRAISPFGIPRRMDASPSFQRCCFTLLSFRPLPSSFSCCRALRGYGADGGVCLCCRVFSWACCSGFWPCYCFSRCRVGPCTPHSFLLAVLPERLEFRFMRGWFSRESANHAAPVNAPVALRFQVGHPWRRVTEPRRWVS
jgi:hypothetical protein